MIPQNLHCPNCNAARAESATDCAACGIVFAKWRATEDRLREAGVAAAAAPPASARREERPVLLRLAAAGVVFAGWFLVFHASPGAPPAPEAVPDKGAHFSMALPAGWVAENEGPCGGAPAVCWTLRASLPTSRPDEWPARIDAGFSDAKASPGWNLDKAASAAAQELRESYAGAQVNGPYATTVDGLNGRRVDFSAVVKRRVETQPKIAVSEQEALRQLKEKNPGQSMFWVKTEYDPRRKGGPAAVVMQEAVTVDVENPVEGARLLLPARGGLVAVSFVLDGRSAASQNAAVDAALKSLRVASRPRPMDGSSGALLLVGMIGLSAAALKFVA